MHRPTAHRLRLRRWMDAGDEHDPLLPRPTAMSEAPEPQPPILGARSRVSSARRGVLSFLVIAALLALTVSAALLGKQSAGQVTAHPTPTIAALRTAPAVSSPVAAVLASPTPPGIVDPLSVPVWQPPAGAVRQLPIITDTNLAADGDAVYYAAIALDGRGEVHRLDIASGADSVVASVPVAHDISAVAAADGRAAWVEWWVPGGGFTGGPCAPGQPVAKAWRIWLRDAAHPEGRVIASGTAREGWAVAQGCLDPVPPRIALSADAYAFDVRSSGHTTVEVHALSDGRRLFTYGLGTSAFVSDLRLAGKTLAVAAQELSPVTTTYEVTLLHWRGGTPSAVNKPGLGVALAPDGSVSLVVQPLNPGATGQRAGMALYRQLVGSSGPIMSPLWPPRGAPDAESADSPSIGTWQGAEADLWRGIAPDGRAYPVLQVAGDPRVLVGYGTPGWTAISGHWAMWTDVAAATPTLDVLDLSAVPVAPAVTATNPSVSVTPASGLFDGQTVAVQVSGFGIGGKVWLSECASAQDASSLGCGRQLAEQPFLVTDDARSGDGSFTVSLHAATAPDLPNTAVRCTDQCVIVATLGDGFAYATAPIRFSPAATLPVLPCTARQLATSVVDTGDRTGLVEGWLRLVNTGVASCEISGWPTLVGITASGATTVARQSNELLDLPPDTVLPPVPLAPGGAAVAGFAGSAAPTGVAQTCPPPYHILRVTLPGTTGSVTLPGFNHWLNADLPACGGLEVTQVISVASEPFLLPWRP